MTYCNVFIFKDSNSTDKTLFSVTDQVWDSWGAGTFSVSSIKGDPPPRHSLHRAAVEIKQGNG